MEQENCSLVSTTENTILFALSFLLLWIAWHRNIEINTIDEMESLSFIVISISKWCGRFRPNEHFPSRCSSAGSSTVSFNQKCISHNGFKRLAVLLPPSLSSSSSSSSSIYIAIVWQLYHFHLLQFVALGFLSHSFLSQQNDDAILANKFNNIW